MRLPQEALEGVGGVVIQATVESLKASGPNLSPVLLAVNPLANGLLANSTAATFGAGIVHGIAGFLAAPFVLPAMAVIGVTAVVAVVATSD